MGLWRHETLFKSPFPAIESRGGAAAAVDDRDDGFGDNAGDHGSLVMVVDDGVGGDDDDVGDGNDCLFCSYDKKYHCQGSLQKNAFTWAYRSRGLRVHHGREAWQQIAGRLTGAGSRGLTS